MYKTEDSRTIKRSEEELCVPESQLRPLDNCTGLEIRQTDKDISCCGLSSQVLNRLVKKPEKECCVKTQQSKTVITLVFIVINIVLTILLLAFTVQWYIYKHDLLTLKEEVLCVPESQLRPLDNCTGLEIRQTDKDISCCGLTSQVLNRLVKKHAQKPNDLDLLFRDYVRQESVCRNTMSAVKVSSPILDQSEPPNRLNWTHTDMIRAEDIEHRDAFLTVKQPGYYYVFSQVEFSISRSPGNSRNHVHYINKHSPKTGEEVTLLESSRSQCEYLPPTGAGSSYTGAVFKLDKDDQIFVRVSHPEKNKTPYKSDSFFGAYLI